MDPGPDTGYLGALERDSYLDDCFNGLHDFVVVRGLNGSQLEKLLDNLSVVEFLLIVVQRIVFIGSK